jgi:thiamine biosynthesis lipoprotein
MGARLVALGSRDHLVELGGEVRAWGTGPDGAPWRVRLRGGDDRVVELRDGEALGTATRRTHRSPLDPRTGRPAVAAAGSVTVRASSCAAADAWAVVAAVTGVVPDSESRSSLRD